MTELDLRIKYRSETGFPPTYGRTGGPQFGCNYKGALTHKYAEWLEEYRGPNPEPMSMTWQRYSFLKETGLYATYYDRDRNIRYNREYKLWMEELLCNVFTILHQ